MFSERHFTWLKASVLGFWAIWFVLSFSANLNDGLMNWNMVNSVLPFHTHDYGILMTLMSVYHSTPALFNLGYVFYICVLAVSAILFITAFIRFLSCGASERTADWVAIAFTFSIFISLLILVLSAVYVSFSLEPWRVVFLSFQILSLMLMRWA